ncbi:MAG: nucleotide exchange factor GrpE [Selenomonadaceae bacterium]|nr:nucleotide exchange factor GrpE [Selenomonadaceae bacterium]
MIIFRTKKKGADELADEKKVTIDNEDGDTAELNIDLTAGKNSEETNSESSSNGEENFSAEIENLKNELSAKNDRLLRLQADFDNFRRRAAKEKMELAATIEQSFLKDLLPLLDNLSRASQAAEGENSDAETLRKGIEMIKQETVTALGKHGLEPIDTKDKIFDPNFHQAVGTVQDETKEDGAIAAEFQRGYMAHGKVIRPSMVQVVNN